MSRVATVFLVLLAAALAAAVVSTRSCSPDSAGARLVFNTDPAAVQSLRITNGGESFELKRRGQAWQILGNDLKDRADPRKVGELLDAATSLEWLDRIPAAEIRDKDDLATYGLKSARRSIELEARDTKKLILGSEAALPGRIYARFDGAREVYLVPDTLSNLLPPNARDLRDRRLSDVPSSQVDALVIRNDLGEIELERTPSGWQLVKPLRATADDETVDKYLVSLLGAPILDFVADDTGNLGLHGITEGRSEVAFRAEGRERPQVLRFGSLSHTPPASILAQFTGRDSVIHLPAVSRGLIEVTPQHFRDRHILPFTLDFVDRIRIRSGSEVVELDRSGEGWSVRTPEGLKPADPTAAEKLLETLASTKALEFVARQSSPPPTARSIELVSVLSENTPEATAGETPVAVLDISAPAAGRCVVSLRAGSDDAVVDASFLDSLPSTASDLLP